MPRSIRPAGLRRLFGVGCATLAFVAACAPSAPAAPTAAPAPPKPTTAPAAAPAQPSPSAAAAASAVPSPAAKPAAGPVQAPIPFTAKPGVQALTVRVAQSTPAISFAPLYVARDMGFFEYQGLKLEFTELQAGSTAQQALLGGSVDVVDSASAEVGAAVSKGVPLIAIQNTVNMTQEVCVRKDWMEKAGVTPASPLQDRIKSLKGASISITGPGSASDRGMRWLLTKYGAMDPNKDVQIVQIGGSSAVTGALEQNRVQAFLQSPPNCEVAQQAGFGVVLVKPSEVPEWRNYVHEVLYTSRDWTSKNREQATRVATALSMGNNYMLQHPDESILLLQKSFKSVDPKIIDQVVREIILPQVKPDGKMTEAMWKETNSVLLESGQIQSPLDTKEGVMWTNEYIGNPALP